MDVLYVALTLAFAGAMVGFTALCAAVEKKP